MKHWTTLMAGLTLILLTSPNDMIPRSTIRIALIGSTAINVTLS